MKSMYQAIALTGANLLALGLNMNDTTVLKPQFAELSETKEVQRMTSSQLRSIEASHLEIYAGCKWGHASFDPVKIESEELSVEVRSLYSEMA